MALSDRVKDVFQGSEQDPNYRPPGSFPTDDMAPGNDSTATDSVHQRNKLHKSNDPRARGHGHTDSGVGLMESSHEPAVTKEPVEDAYAPAEGYEQRREHAQRSDVAEFDDVKADQRDTTEYDVDPKDLGATAGTTGTTGAAFSTQQQDDTPRNVVRSGTQSSTVDHKDPYWGDLPQGQGVYNTVSGHGSHSDEARRHQPTDEGADHRSFPLVTDRTRQHHPDPTERSEPERTQEQKDSHWKEGAAGAAVAGAAGTAAYKATRDDEQRPTETEKETPEEKEKKGRGGLFGVFHRSSKDDKDKDRHHKDKDHHHKEEKKHAKEEKIAPVAAAGYAAHDDKRQGEQRYQEQNPSDNTRSTKTDPALAAAAVAYSQHDDRAKSSNRHNDPASRGNEGQYNVLSSGTASGVRNEEYGTTSTRDTATSRDLDERKESNRNAAVYGTTGAAAALGAGGYAAHELRKDRDNENEPLSKEPHEESSRSGGWFTSPATTTTTRTTEPAQSQRDDYTADDSSKRTGGFVAAPVPTDMSTRDPAAETYPSASSQPAIAASQGSVGTSQPSMREPSSEMPRSTEEANEGKYNTLSSGTPSGINLGEDKPKAVSALPTVQDESSNRGAMATAGLAAAGAGAGAAALASRRDDEEEKEPEEIEEKPLKKEAYTGAAVVPGNVGSQEKVTHKCVKCGEENDISQYFKDKVRGGN